MTAAPTLDAQLRHLEEQLLQPEVRGSAERLAALLAEDFVEFGSSGRVFSKNQIIAALAEETPAKRSLSEFEATMLAGDVVLVTYRATRRSHAGAVHTLRSSIWRRSKGQWQMVFHQGTPAAMPVPPPTECPERVKAILAALQIRILCVSAPPGYSEHHSGRAIDLTTDGVRPLELEFEHTNAFRWLSTNAGRFGFVLSVPAR